MKMFSLSLLLVCVSYVTSVERLKNATNHIARVNSNLEVPKEIYQFVVSLQRNRRHFCTGAAYSDHYILTAATCVRGLEPDDIEVLAGTKNLYTGGEYYEVAKIISKEPSGPGKVHDNIALIRTKQQLSQMPTFHMPESDISLDISRNADAVGWGSKVSIFVSKKYYLF